MSYSRTEIIAELRRLPARRGIQEPDIGDKIGPALRAIAGISEDAKPAEIRKEIAELLNSLIDGLPADLAFICRAAFALDANLSAPFLTERKKLIAHEIARDDRTVARRINAGCDLIAELMEGSLDRARPVVPEIAGPPWRTTELHASVSFDLPVPEVHETRQIVAERDGLDWVGLELTLSAPPGGPYPVTPSDLGMNVLYGGLLTNRVMKSSSRVGFDLRPPLPLDRGDGHKYAVKVTMPPERPMAPYYVCTPRFPCDLFELHVRFGTDRVPKSIWRLDAVPSHELDDPASDRQLVRADGSGEVAAVFTGLEPHRSYGFAWRG